MRVLITGSQGYVAPSVIQMLRAYQPDCTIDGLDICFFSHLVSNQYVGTGFYLENLRILDIRRVNETNFSQYDVIVHLAAISNDPMGITFDSATKDINFESTKKLALMAKEQGVKKFIFASSASVYGFSDSICDESSTTKPLTAYAKSKVDSENFLESIAGKDFEVTCLRFSTACGWSPRLRTDIAINNFVSTGIIEKRIVLNSDGKASRPFVATEDMGRAVAWAVSEHRSKLQNFEKVNIGKGNWNFSILEIAELVQSKLKDAKLIINKNAPQDKRSYQLDFNKYSKYCFEYYLKENIDDVVDNLIKKISFDIFNYSKNYINNGSRLQTLNWMIEENLINIELIKRR
jgi:nucleoside-diphosphate-sugar epimerase